MQDIVKELLDHMTLERLEINLFRGQSRDIGSQRVFGGQVLGQSLLAASQTVEERHVHSLHAYFLRAGDPSAPIVYDVDRSRDGGSFSVRRVVAIQHGRPIFNMAASFHREETGSFQHQLSMPDVPKPEELESFCYNESTAPKNIPEKLKRWLAQKGPFEFRSVEKIDPLQPEKQAAQRHVWLKCRSNIGNNSQLHRSLLAYVSDYHLIVTAMLPHGISMLDNNLQLASLDHAMWFHRDCRVDDWLLYVCDSPNANNNRGFTRGSLFTIDGSLVASTAQEGLIRIR